MVAIHMTVGHPPEQVGRGEVRPSSIIPYTSASAVREFHRACVPGHLLFPPLHLDVGHDLECGAVCPVASSEYPR